jgi:hypothetical protein
MPNARRLARFTLAFLLLVLPFALPSCGGKFDDHPVDLAIDFHSETKNGEEVGLPALEPAISRADARAIVDGFSWERTTPLTELTDDGEPALYYAAIYVKNRQEVRYLDDARIHHTLLPLFEHERARWRGQKGRMSPSTDGVGQFIFAIVPGRIYNLIREYALRGDALFSVIHLLDVPEPVRDSHGALRYDSLAQAGFRYRNMDPTHDASPTTGSTGTQQQGLIILTARLALKVVAEAAEELPRLIARAAGNRDRNGLIFGWGAAGTAHMHVTLALRDTDEQFGGVLGPAGSSPDPSRRMQRAWGKEAGQYVELPGVRVSVWSHGDATVLWLPTLFEGTTDAFGQTDIAVAKDRNVREICIATENEAAEVTDFLTEIEVCDFKSFTEGKIDDLKFDTSLTVGIQDSYFNVLAQATEGRAYLRDVVGYTPHQAVILVGTIADLMGSFGTGAAFTPCLGFPNISADAMVAALLGVIAIGSPGAAVALGAITPLMAVDMVLPTHGAITTPAHPFVQASLDSRGVPTHEYGHFATCSMLYDSSVTKISGTWTSAVIERIGSGAVPPASASKAYDIEAFADFFAGQVAGGVNYFTPANSYPKSLDMSFCEADLQCLDVNRAARTDFFEQVARVATTLHDAFDGQFQWLPGVVDRPDDGDAWIKDSGLLTYSSVKNGNGYDEPIALRGTNIRKLIDRIDGFGETSVMQTLASIILEEGYTWCEACQLFALHDDKLAGGTLADKYAVCGMSPITGWLGPVPNPQSPTSCNFTMCPLGSIVDFLTKTCVACPPGTISVDGFRCEACPPGTTVIDNVCRTCDSQGNCDLACAGRQVPDNGVCVDCPFAEIAVNGTCQPCPAGQLRYENTCVTTCPPGGDALRTDRGVCEYIFL